MIVNDNYIGTPDPSKYLQGTNFLSEVELNQEIENGNLLPIKVRAGAWTSMAQHPIGPVHFCTSHKV